MHTTHHTNHERKSAPAPDLAPSRMIDDRQALWALTDHCCRVCFSRVLVRDAGDRRKVYRCAGCGVEQEGRTPAVVCACGMKLKTGADAGVRCEVATNPTPEFPAQVTASQREACKPITS